MIRAAPGLLFRAGVAGDQAALWALRTRCVREVCRTHYPPAVIERWSASAPPSRYPDLVAHGGCVIAEDAQRRLCGYGILIASLNEVDALFVDPDRAGQGIGRAVLERVMALADPRRDIVLTASLNAVAFYQAAGFLIEGEHDYPHPSGVMLASMQMRRAARL